MSISSFSPIFKIIFGEDFSDISTFSNFLTYYISNLNSASSVLSDKSVLYTGQYSDGSRFISFDEVENFKSSPININDIKDVDSLFRVAKENAVYSGNIITGISKDIKDSVSVSDSANIYHSRDIAFSRDVLYSEKLSEVKYMVGCSWGTRSSFSINSTEFDSIYRSFESSLSLNSSDIYYSYNCKGCQELMFSSHLFSKRYVVGNNELPKDKYFSLKNKLLSEMVAELKHKGKLPHLIDFYLGGFDE